MNTPLLKGSPSWRRSSASSQSWRRASTSSQSLIDAHLLPSLQILSGVALVAAGCLFGFLLGRRSIPMTIDAAVIPLSEYTSVFEYNRTFGDVPSPQSDAAWETIFPEYGGYITHPEIAPTRSAISVFHQLHCLNSVRKAFWTVYELAETGTQLQSDHLAPHMSPPHMRHCIDLLRQSLMCQPDLTIEPLNEELGGVTGFGAAHQCKDWSELYDFVSDWEYHDMDADRIQRHKALLESHHSRD